MKGDSLLNQCFTNVLVVRLDSPLLQQMLFLKQTVLRWLIKRLYLVKSFYIIRLSIDKCAQVKTSQGNKLPKTRLAIGLEKFKIILTKATLKMFRWTQARGIINCDGSFFVKSETKESSCGKRIQKHLHDRSWWEILCNCVIS